MSEDQSEKLKDCKSTDDGDGLWTGGTENLEKHLAAGASPDEVVDHHSGRRMLHEAARRGNASAVQLLVSQGANVQARTYRGDTALHFCAESGCCEAARTLLMAGADVAATNDSMETALHLSASSEDGVEVLELLLQHGAKVDAVDGYADNCLHRACFAENTDAVRFMLKQQREVVNLPNAEGFRGLHIAAAQENSELLGIMLRHGADLTLCDMHNCTAVDMLLSNEDTSGIDSLGRFLFRSLRQFAGGEQAVEVISSDPGRQFLQQLMVIEGVREPGAALEGVAKTEKIEQLRNVISKRKVDAGKFINELVEAFSAGLLEDLRNSDLLELCAWKVCELVLLPQDETLLQLLVGHRLLWATLSFAIESRIEKLYARTLRKKKAGVRELLRRTCSDASGKAICWQRLSSFVAGLTSYWQFHNRQLYMVNEETGWSTWHKRPLQDPLQSLVIWSILSSRLKLVPILLRQEQFDLVPQALLATNVLRTLGQRRDIEDVFADKASRIADICEGMALQVLKAVKDVDNSHNNCLTIDYISLPLPSFANYNILDLAARGNASEIIKLDAVEQSIEKSWYGDFYEFRSNIARELVILSGFIPPFMLLLPRFIQRFRGRGSKSFMEAMTASKKKNENEQAKSQQTQGETNQIVDHGELTAQQHSLERRQQKFSHRANEYMSAMLLFYSTPCVKFRLHAAFYFLLVSLLSYMILHDFQGKISFVETFCYLSLLGVFIEELREMVACSQQENLREYLTDGWNAIDLVAIACGFFAFVFRRMDPDDLDVLTLSSEHVETWRDLSYVLIVTTTLIFWIRMLFIAIVLESVGVKLKMLSLMIKKDFIPFLYILIVIMLGFGIAFHALLWPNAKYFSQGKYVDIPPIQILLDMFRRTFYTIVGEYGLDDLGNECDMTNNGTDGGDGDVKCVGYPGSMLVPYVLMVVYIVIVQVLLLNVIVAMFSKTIDMVDSESKSMWLFERYDLMQEFTKRGALPPPLNLALELRNLIALLMSRIVALRRQPSSSVLAILSQNLKNFVYCFYLFYQSVAMRRARRRLDGMDIDEDEISDETLQVLRQLRKQQELLERVAAATEAE